ncbi:MAG: hypothetical protein P4K98_13220 [Bryobacteraceae bacterium]|nr:hypothetical protein [Bryobacteraceae bacterium]
MNVDRMKQELTRLGTRELELEDTRVQLEAALDQAQERAADLIISGGKPADSVETVRGTEIVLSSLERAIHALRGRRREALTRLREAEQAEAQAEVARRLAVVAELEAKTLKALGKVAEIQGVTEPYNLWFVEALSPRTRALRAEIEPLQYQANNVTEVPATGYVDCTDVTSAEPLEQAVLFDESLTPSLHDLRCWLHDVEQVVIQRRGEGFGEHPRRYRVTWDNGRIDRAASYVFCAAFGTPLAPTYGTVSPGIDIPSATFKAPQQRERACA